MDERQERMTRLVALNSKGRRHKDNYPVPVLKEVYDEETGEHLKTVATAEYDPEKFRISQRRDNYEPNKTGKYGRPYRVMFDVLGEILVKNEVEFIEFSFLSACVACLEYGTNYVCDLTTKQRMSKRRFAEYVGRDKNYTNRVLASLAQKGFIALEPYRNYECIRLDPTLGFYGKAEEYHKLIEQSRMKAQ